MKNEEKVIFRNRNKVKLFFRCREFTRKSAHAKLNKDLLTLNADPQTIRYGGVDRHHFVFTFTYVGGITEFARDVKTYGLDSKKEVEDAKPVVSNDGD